MPEMRLAVLLDVGKGKDVVALEMSQDAIKDALSTSMVSALQSKAIHTREESMECFNAAWKSMLEDFKRRTTQIP